MPLNQHQQHQQQQQQQQQQHPGPLRGVGLLSVCSSRAKTLKRAWLTSSGMGGGEGKDDFSLFLPLEGASGSSSSSSSSGGGVTARTPRASGLLSLPGLAGGSEEEEEVEMVAFVAVEKERGGGEAAAAAGKAPLSPGLADDEQKQQQQQQGDAPLSQVSLSISIGSLEVQGEGQSAALLPPLSPTRRQRAHSFEQEGEEKEEGEMRQQVEGGAGHEGGTAAAASAQAGEWGDEAALYAAASFSPPLSFTMDATQATPAAPSSAEQWFFTAALYILFFFVHYVIASSTKFVYP
jgi:hypothetical protein